MNRGAWWSGCLVVGLCLGCHTLTDFEDPVAPAPLSCQDESDCGENSACVSGQCRCDPGYWDLGKELGCETKAGLTSFVLRFGSVPGLDAALEEPLRLFQVGNRAIVLGRSFAAACERNTPDEYGCQFGVWQNVISSSALTVPEAAGRGVMLGLRHLFAASLGADKDVLVEVSFLNPAGPSQARVFTDSCKGSYPVDRGSFLSLVAAPGHATTPALLFQPGVTDSNCRVRWLTTVDGAFQVGMDDSSVKDICEGRRILGHSQGVKTSASWSSLFVCSDGGSLTLEEVRPRNNDGIVVDDLKVTVDVDDLGASVSALELREAGVKLKNHFWLSDRSGRLHVIFHPSDFTGGTPAVMQACTAAGAPTVHGDLVAVGNKALAVLGRDGAELCLFTPKERLPCGRIECHSLAFLVGRGGQTLKGRALFYQDDILYVLGQLDAQLSLYAFQFD